MKRIAVVGTTGSGKSTLARRLSEELAVAHIELDALHWKPNWTEAPHELFRQEVRRALAGGAWIVDGNYGKVRDLIWPQADTLVWLDYPLPLTFWRLFKRTLKRILMREDLWNSGNRESIITQFFTGDSLFIWAWKSHWRHRREYPQALAQPEYAHLRVVRLYSPQAADAWCRKIRQQRQEDGRQK